jgi:hypothetical protein
MSHPIRSCTDSRRYSRGRCWGWSRSSICPGSLHTRNQVWTASNTRVVSAHGCRADRRQSGSDRLGRVVVSDFGRHRSSTPAFWAIDPSWLAWRNICQPTLRLNVLNSASTGANTPGTMFPMVRSADQPSDDEPLPSPSTSLILALAHIPREVEGSGFLGRRLGPVYDTVFLPRLTSGVPASDC